MLRRHILPQCSSSLLSPQSSSWSHLKARGMQEPEATQRNWLVGSQVVVATSGQDTGLSSNEGTSCIFRRGGAAEHLRHSCSSLMSPQSLSLSHFQMLLMQRPLAQRYWLGKQLCSDWRKKKKMKPHFQQCHGCHNNLLYCMFFFCFFFLSPVLMQVLFRSW